MSWIYLIIAGVMEVIAVYGMNRAANKYKDGYIVMPIAFGISLILLTLAMETINMGVAYAVWTGIGTCGSAIMGMIVFKESRDWRRFLCIGIIVASVIGLKLVS
ncbi:QacE family quaternary ammonium compound efflux SMR transporter [Lysinibacillus alkalisoli]|uniref:QacE family quaternary ammonium compound efflux SMR transporter n=1 Tax=Lysinibacillus alkalisoli TaxID=1911548 RepID=A0A917LJ12_9BACI|nr:multidrug efflux SMR transporter [Lysinibacillus alkalisoli]GGG31524.1 QacE family quaternary ammonium compound efflux SMR transporter [Lysinibacillus alkalisoli]